MRKEKELVPHYSHDRQSALRLQALDAPEVRTPQYLKDWFIPRRETRLMSDEAQRMGGIFLPYPLLAIIMTLVITLGGGIVGMYVKLDTMNSTMLMRDNDHKDALLRLEKKDELQEMYLKDMREQLAEMRGQLGQQKKRSN